MRRPMSLRRQLLLLQAAIVVITIGTVGLVAMRMQESQIRDSYEQRMVGVAQSVATLPSVVEAYEDPDPSAVIQPIAELIREASGVTYVVVTDAEGIRYSHPNVENIGQMVSTDPSEPLSGRVYVGTQTGTMGESWRVKVPIWAGGEVIGSVSVGTLEETLRAELMDDLPPLFGWLLGAGLVGTLGAVYISRLVWRRIYRMEPEEIASLRDVREAMLHGLGEGMVAVDEHDRIALANDQARRMLDLPEDCIGKPAGDVLAPALTEILAGPDEVRDTLVLVGEQILFVRVDRAEVDDRQVGSVLLLRDRTEIYALVRDLDGARDLTQALRAQAHEFANHMHVVSGLIELGREDEAVEFIARTGRSGVVGMFGSLPGVTDPAVGALLLAKTAIAHERGVSVRTDPEARIEPDGTTDVVTILGNLIDNAIDAAGSGGTVEVSARRVDGRAVLTVGDDGPGIPVERRQHVFEAGVSTKDGARSRGIGLTLVRQVVDRRGGTIQVGDSETGGASVEVELPAARFSAEESPGVQSAEKLPGTSTHLAGVAVSETQSATMAGRAEAGAAR
ncbi:ATP-binding protein [Georgenia sp. Z1491]|uniref:ATP-binding protein n=1 Tax=Georgenia sp. Z1491 TaxID=3416707 RepID=UPI003CE6C1B5